MEIKDWISIVAIICSTGAAIYSALNLRKVQNTKRNDDLDLQAFSHSLETKLEEFKTSLTQERSFLEESGRNAATKKDIEEITQKVEKIRNEFITGVEVLKSNLSKKANLHKLQAEKEFEVYSLIWDKAVDLKFSVQNLRPYFEEIDFSKTEKDKWNEKYKRARVSLSDLQALIEKQRPFYPEVIYFQLQDLIKKSWIEIVDFEACLDTESWKMSSDGYKRGQENVYKIVDNLKQVCDLMRARISDS